MEISLHGANNYTESARYVLDCEGAVGILKRKLTGEIPGYITTFQTFNEGSIDLDPHYFYAYLQPELSEYDAWFNVKDDLLVLGVSVKNMDKIGHYYRCFIAYMEEKYHLRISRQTKEEKWLARSRIWNDRGARESMRYYQCEKYPIEFVVSENIDKRFDSHNHVGHYIVSLVMQGEVTVYLGNGKLVCHEGDVFTIPPYAMHSVCQEREACLLSMCIGTAFVMETDSETAEGIVRGLLKDAVGQGIFGKAQEEKLLVSMQAVFHVQDMGGKEMDTDIKILADRITSNPEFELPIETLAADIFVSKYYLIKKFKRSVGMTPHQFCIQNRIRKSQGLLNEEKTVSRIATEMGFYDQSHFDKAFQKIVGISPSEYIHSKKQIGQST